MKQGPGLSAPEGFSLETWSSSHSLHLGSSLKPILSSRLRRVSPCRKWRWEKATSAPSQPSGPRPETRKGAEFSGFGIQASDLQTFRFLILGLDSFGFRVSGLGEGYKREQPALRSQTRNPTPETRKSINPRPGIRKSINPRPETRDSINPRPEIRKSINARPGT